ncbi:hypothetical protein KFL_000960140 [Klebsormidium nitens]|uniref:Endonuclease/exonuclease/phosphatase domain-containing protein n=1 Tax=Klebsormidium nitens TaxID=105231 RepID=A0A0U9HK03_KLENI|nr:hypothetical protein KFL_000960140 [Klebsormidium nitens]|eukprot:GAQ81963.1 hypothetical protein KFL_000960140 [Klebsormidium nitens]
MGRTLPILLLHPVFLIAISALLQLTSATLLLGQIVTGSGYNKAIEVRNPGPFSEAVNLTQFGLLWLPNGQDFRVSGWQQLQAPIAAETALVPGGGSYLIAHTRAAPWLVGNASALSEAFLFDGNDVLALAMRADNNTWLPIDIVGNPNRYNASGWAVAGLPSATRNHTLFRKTSITSPTVNWTLSAGTDAASSQWIVLPSTVLRPGGSNGTGSVPLTSGQCSKAAGVTSDRRKNKSVLKVAMWTVDWLFDGVSDPAGSPWNGGASCPGNPGDPGFTPLNQCNAAGAAARIQRVVRRIKDLDVDILNLVQVESCGVLQQLVNGSDAGYASYLGVSNDSVSGLNLGLLFRLDPILPIGRILGNMSYPLPGSACGFSGTGTTDATANFRTTFQVLNRSVAFIGMELPGFPRDPESCAVREAQAAIISAEVQRRIAAGQEVVLAGNLNDWSAVDTDPLGHVPISRVLQSLQYPNASGPPQLISAATWLSDANRYTSEGPAVAGGFPAPQQVDFILVTQGLASLNVTVQIAHDNATLQSLSSHWPLVLTLQVPDSKTATVAPVAQVLLPNVTTSSNSSSSVVVPSPVATSSLTSTLDRKSSSSLLLPIVLGSAGGALFVALACLLVFVGMRRRKRVYSHRRLQKQTQLEGHRQSLEVAVEQKRESTEERESMVENVDEDKDDWRPIDRSMPTIKSGEILELGLYAKSPFDDD